MFIRSLFIRSWCIQTGIKNVLLKISYGLIVALMLPTAQSIAQTVVQQTGQQWTLQSSVQQALSASPELKKSMAEIGVRQTDINLSSLWPEPSIAFRIDNKLGQDDATGGYDLTDITISQPIPISRIKYQTSVAEASLKAARFSRLYQSLQVQNRVSKVFFQLQLASAELALAKKQLQLADKLINQTEKNTRSVVVRYLTPLEKMRMTIIREEADQAASSAEGKYNEALSEFVKLLGIAVDNVATVPELQPLVEMPDINQLTALQEHHAQLSSQQQQVLAAKHKIDVARNSQLVDPTVGLSWSRDTFPNGRDDVYAVMFNMQIPLGDRKNAAASKASYKASQQRIELALLKRELKINLNKSFTHLNHVVEQARGYKQKVLKPAQKMLDLTNRGFSSGELNILSLVDANNTYFEARLNYLQLLYQAWVELAEVKLFAGQMIKDVDTQSVSLFKGEV
ncbi:TolC family protein [Cardiobacterium sp. AH-315-I02]|nr:TolC family protein [Cardiobacterium sp. AH-315-I02]